MVAEWDRSEGREVSQQMDRNQCGPSCYSASQQAPCSLMAADCVQNRRQDEVQHYCGVTHRTDQKVLKHAKRLVPWQGIGVWRGPRRLGAEREGAGDTGGDEPSDVRFLRLLYFSLDHEELVVRAT